MTRRLLLWLFLAAATGTASAQTEAADGPPEVSYADLSLHLPRYDGKTIRAHGKFHYLQNTAPVFEMLMGDHPVSVFISQLPPESQQVVRGLRPFSDTPLVVTGVPRYGPEHGNDIFIMASKIDVEGSSAHYSYDPKNGIVTCPEITRFSQRYLNSPATVQGRFDFRSPSENVFTIWRGTDSMEVDFGRLPNDVQTTLLQEPNFSNRVVTVKGVVRPSPLRQGQYRIEASSVEFTAPPADAAPAETKPGQPPSATYADLLAKPAAYAGKKVLMRGSYECPATAPHAFQIRVGPDTIEVIGDKLPVSVQNRLHSLTPFTEVALRVTGTVRAYSDSGTRYYLVADKVEFLE